MLRWMEQQQFQSTVLEMLRIFQEQMRATQEDIRGLKEEMRDVREEMREMRLDTNNQFQNVHMELRSQKEKLDEVYYARSKVRVTFGWEWGLMSLLIAIIASGITQIFGK